MLQLISQREQVVGQLLLLLAHVFVGLCARLLQLLDFLVFLGQEVLKLVFKFEFLGFERLVLL